MAECFGVFHSRELIPRLSRKYEWVVKKFYDEDIPTYDHLYILIWDTPEQNMLSMQVTKQLMLFLSARILTIPLISLRLEFTLISSLFLSWEIYPLLSVRGFWISSVGRLLVPVWITTWDGSVVREILLTALVISSVVFPGYENLRTGFWERFFGSIYSCFDKGCPTEKHQSVRDNTERRDGLLFTLASSSSRVFSTMEGGAMNTCLRLLKETKWIFELLTCLFKFIEYFPGYLSALSRTLLRFFWTTFVETAVCALSLNHQLWLWDLF